MQTEEICRDSFSLEAAVSHLCQSTGGLVCSCTPHSSCENWNEPWLVLLKGGDVCVSDLEPLYNMNVLNFLETDILQRQHLL